ncbi:MAG: DUF4097 family beta strand repeat-containing protein [Gemmatimonadota bacterium]|nr:DUF4097 family beta strand repeat-containing protein [Gemmatimonadota bacterium]
MLPVLASGLLAIMALVQTDTTVAVERGQRLQVSAHTGEIVVKTWARNAVRVQAASSDRGRVAVITSATAVRVRTEGRHGPASLELHITAPTWMAVDLSGVYTDISVAGAGGAVAVETVQGDVDVEGGVGLVSLRSVQGSVTLRRATGRIEVHSVNEGVEVFGSSGEIEAETVNGDITLNGVAASSLTATTVNGDVEYDGPIRTGGRYSLSSHNGDLTLTVAPETSASVSVSTFNGEFESEFPVTLKETGKGKRFSFTIGAGSAQVTLESFQGTISLIRPGSNQARDEDH